MAHPEIIIDHDPWFEINPTTREITQLSAGKFQIGQYDHNSERFTFSIPKYIDGHDMLECNRVEVHYLTNGQTPGTYIVDDLQIDPNDGDRVTCSWLLSRNATSDKGIISFLLRYSCILDDGTVDYAWSTAIYKKISIIEGMNCTPEELEEYYDFIETMLIKANNYTDEQVAEINASIDELNSMLETLLNGGATNE